jgi:GT2 family glycosyltransferase
VTLPADPSSAVSAPAAPASVPATPAPASLAPPTPAAASGGARVRWRAEDLTVVIPTRDRWDVVAETVAALGRQSVQGFEVVVVADGEDQRPPPLAGATVHVQRHTGPGGARNRGVALSDRPLVLFLGDDMVPTADLVARHLERHRAEPDEQVGVLGRAVWHPAAARGRLQRWLAWSGHQFDDASIVGDDAGWARFYSCNVSLHRRFFVDAGGFDEDFAYYYEDLDLGWRLGQRGLRLRYEPAALALHRHRYDTAAVERRFHGIGVGERMMVAKHSWFTPWFLGKVRRAEEGRAPSPLWPVVVDAVPRGAGRLRRHAEVAADRWYLRRLGPALRAGWAAEGDRAELEEYLGEDYDRNLLHGHVAAVEAEERAIGDEQRFYRTARSYLYDLTAFAMSGTKAPYLAEIRAVVPPGGRLLDYGCGIGADGLRLLDDGYQVAFADFANPSTAYLRWRLARRGVTAPVYDLDADEVPGGFDLAYAFDVIEHVDDPVAFLDRLERRAALVAVNLLEEDPNDVDLHRPLPIAALVDRAARRGLVHYRRYHGRSHLLVYRGTATPGSATRGGSALGRSVLGRSVLGRSVLGRSTLGRSVLGRSASTVPRWRSIAERRLGPVLPGRPGWYPEPDVEEVRRLQVVGTP